MQGRNSNPQQKCEAKKGIEPKSETQNSLKKEILQPEMHLKDQQVVRGAMEKALGPGPATVTLQTESPMLKPATLLIREVAPDTIQESIRAAAAVAVLGGSQSPGGRTEAVVGELPLVAAAR